MNGLSDAPLFDLVTKAQFLADTLESAGMAINARIVRELCRRVVPVKIVATTGRPMRVKAVPVPVKSARVWCEQCEKLVATACEAKFCKVVL